MADNEIAKKWYFVHTYSGYENKAKLSLQENIKNSKLEHLFGEILIPTESVVETVKNQKAHHGPQVLPQLHPGRDGSERTFLALREGYTEGDGIRRKFNQSASRARI